MLFGIIQAYVIRTKLYDDYTTVTMNDSNNNNNFNNNINSSDNGKHQRGHENHHDNNNNNEDISHTTKDNMKSSLFRFKLLQTIYNDANTKQLSVEIIHKIKNCHDWTISESLLETKYNRIIL